jgi:rubrerythrin
MREIPFSKELQDRIREQNRTYGDTELRLVKEVNVEIQDGVLEENERFKKYFRYRCNSCNGKFTISRTPRYCPICGRKVKEGTR